MFYRATYIHCGIVKLGKDEQFWMRNVEINNAALLSLYAVVYQARNWRGNSEVLRLCPEKC